MKKKELEMKEKELLWLKGRLKMRQYIFMKYTCVNKRLINDIDEFMKETRRIEGRIINLKKEIEE